jgi:hypothetical protein
MIQEGKNSDDRKQQDVKKKAGLLYIFKEKWNKGKVVLQGRKVIALVIIT